jgi:hypothetical protein
MFLSFLKIFVFGLNILFVDLVCVVQNIGVVVDLYLLGIPLSAIHGKLAGVDHSWLLHKGWKVTQSEVALTFVL